MVPTVGSGIGDFTLADTGSLAGPPPEYSLALRAGLAAVNGRGFRRGAFPSNCSTDDFKQRSPVSAAPHFLQVHKCVHLSVRGSLTMLAQFYRPNRGFMSPRLTSGPAGARGNAIVMRFPNAIRGFDFTARPERANHQSKCQTAWTGLVFAGPQQITR